MSFIRKINVVAVSQQYINDGSYYRPHQGFIYDKSYPFVREIYLISRETFSRIGFRFYKLGMWRTGTEDCSKIGTCTGNNADKAGADKALGAGCRVQCDS